MSVTLESLLRPLPLARKRVKLPARYGENATILIEEMSANSLKSLRNRFGNRGTTDDMEFAAHVVRLCSIKDDGSPLFDDESKADEQVKAFLSSVGAGTFQALADAAIKLSGLATEGEEKN